MRTKLTGCWLVALGALFLGCTDDGPGDAANLDGGVGGAAAGSGGTGGAAAGSGGTGGAAGGSGASGGTGGQAGDGACGCTETSLSWGHDGGFVVYREISTLSPCASFQHTRSPISGEAPDVTCTRELSECAGVNSAADVQAALDHPDVVSALAAAPVLYGLDTRSVDGQVFQLRVGEALVEVGMECGSGGGACQDIPTGVASVAELLQQLTDEQLALAPCSEVFGD
jgi:hypothetical protein